MARKQYFLIVDTETTITDKVVDFGAVICDRHGNIYNQCAVLINGIFGVDDLFHDSSNTGFWTRARLASRMAQYTEQLNNGSRMLASVNAINRWLEKAAGKYNPELTAYNLAFDSGKCQNTGIDLNMFSNRFCLWSAAVGNICQTKKYRQFVLENHLFNKPTDQRNMTYSTTAEAVTGFLSGNMTDEPHTAIEDIIGYELPTLVHILKKRNWRDNIIAYNWRDFQVKNHFGAK